MLADIIHLGHYLSHKSNYCWECFLEARNGLLEHSGRLACGYVNIHTCACRGGWLNIFPSETQISHAVEITKMCNFLSEEKRRFCVTLSFKRTDTLTELEKKYLIT